MAHSARAGATGHLQVLALTRYTRMGASSRVRTMQYVAPLRTHGIDVACMPLFGDSYLQDLYSGKSRSAAVVMNSYLRRALQLLHSRRFDLLWVEKELFPYVPAVFELAALLLGVPLVLDYDDAVFHNYDLGPSLIKRYLLGHKIDALMKLARTTIAGNEYLAARATAAGCRRVAVLPSAIDLQLYSLQPRPLVPQQPAIGWIGSPSSTQYLSTIERALGTVCDRSCASLIVVGAGPLKLAGVPTKVRVWSESTEVERIHEFSVGIMPLKDSPSERGKCGYKLIQYMACGLPVVASPVGVNRQIVEHGVNGFLASTDEEWTSSLSLLLSSPGLRRQMGTAGRRKVERGYCIQATAPILAGLLRESAEH